MKHLKISLTTPNSINKAIEYLENYKAEINQKAQIVLEKLLDVGIESAIINSGQFKGYIVYRKEISPKIDGYEGLLIATDGEKIISEWLYSGQMKSVEVSPLLMAEFGSGQYAVVKFPDVEGIYGRGTFPNQKHAFEDSWWWVDKNPEGGEHIGGEFYKHTSSGTIPTHPMHNAEIAMFNEINRIYREVFGNG